MLTDSSRTTFRPNNVQPLPKEGVTRSPALREEWRHNHPPRGAPIPSPSKDEACYCQNRSWISAVAMATLPQSPLMNRSQLALIPGGDR